MDDLETLPPLGDEIEHDLRRVLQIGVHDDDRLAAGMVHARGDRDLMAEIARQREVAIARVGPGAGGEHDAAGVAAAVVDEDDFRRAVERVEQPVEPQEQDRQHRLFVENRHDQAVDGPSGSSGVHQRGCGLMSARLSAASINAALSSFRPFRNKAPSTSGAPTGSVKIGLVLKTQFI